MPKMIRLLSSLREFLKVEAASGVVLGACAVLAMVIANSPLAEPYFAILHQKIFGLSIHHWINDGLMAVFFFVVGMEIKREALLGELNSWRKAALPVAAAVGGMLAPAGIYLALNRGGVDSGGWPIPMATDIAFAVGVLSLLGKRVPLSLKVFLLALAIVDDLGAILVIAFLFTAKIQAAGIVIAGLAVAAIFAARRFGLVSYGAYLPLGVLLWAGVFYSGIHATIAGVILGFLTPITVPQPMNPVCSRGPLDDLIHRLHPWVSFFIMPVFALANSGIPLSGSSLDVLLKDQVAQGVFLGLFLGKPIGISVVCYVAVTLGVARLPEGIGWKHVLPVASLAGIGFTMALFLAELALSASAVNPAKLAIIAASVLSGVVGFGALFFVLRTRPRIELR